MSRGYQRVEDNPKRPCGRRGHLSQTMKRILAETIRQFPDADNGEIRDRFELRTGIVIARISVSYARGRIDRYLGQYKPA